MSIIMMIVFTLQGLKGVREVETGRAALHLS